MDNVTILRVQLDEGKTEEQLRKLVLDIEATRKAQAALTAERKAGTVSDEEFAKRTVELQTKLKGQQQEQTALTKNLDAYRSAIGKATGSVDQLKAQSALLTAEYNALSQEQRENTEAGRELAAQLEATNQALLEAGQRVGDNRRNVGNYSASLRDAIKESGFLGGITAKVTEAQKTFSQVQVIAKAAIGGNVTALGFLRLALLATGLGALVVVLGSVVAFLTKSQTGIDLVSRKFAGLKAVLDVVVGTAAEFGEQLFAALDNPKQAITDLIAFIEQNLVNRVKAIGIIFQALADRDFRKANDGLIQLTIGVTDASSKLEAFGKVALAAAKAGEAIEAESQRILAAERALNVERSQSRARIEELKKLSDDSTKSVAVRTAAAKQAAAIENGLLAAQVKLQEDKIRNELAGQKLRKVVTNEDRDRLADLQREQADTQQESLTLQTELQNKINSLVQEGFDKTIEGRAQALALEKALLDKQLAQVKVSSEEELAIRKKLLDNARAAELNVKNLTVAQKRVIDTKYESDSLALTIDFNRRKLIASLTAQADLTAAALAGQQDGSNEALKLQAEQIEQQRQQAIAGLQANADNTAAITRINAQAAKQQRDLEYQQVAKALQDDIARRKQLVEVAYADGLIKEREYQEKLAQLNKLGTDTQTAINKKYLQDNSANQQQADANELEARHQHTADVKKTEEAKQEIREATLDSFQAGTDLIIQLFGEESAAGQAALAFRKILALAEIGINLQKTLSLNAVAAAELGLIPIVGPALSAAYLTTRNTLAIAQAAISAATVLAFEQGGIAHVGGGGVADGPSHRHGGIPLYYRGRAAGIEIEGGEPVLTKSVSQNPLLLSLASTVNQLAGGRALAPNLVVPQMALGDVSQPLALDQLRGNAGQSIDYKQLARAMQKVNLSVSVRDTTAAAERKAFTDGISNS